MALSRPLAGVHSGTWLSPDRREEQQTLCSRRMATQADLETLVRGRNAVQHENVRQQAGKSCIRDAPVGQPHCHKVRCQSRTTDEPSGIVGPFPCQTPANTRNSSSEHGSALYVSVSYRSCRGTASVTSMSWSERGDCQDRRGSDWLQRWSDMVFLSHSP